MIWAELLTTRLGTDWTEIDLQTLENYEAIKTARTIFINCSTSEEPTPAAVSSLRQFVANGGMLYTSDWAYTCVQAAFPGYLAFADPEPLAGESGAVTATITDRGLREYVFGNVPTPQIDLIYELPRVCYALFCDEPKRKIAWEGP